MNPNTSHAFNVAEAVAYGVESAILLNNVRFWLANNKANKKNDHEGFWWTYNSGAAFSELFPYMKERSISRNLKTLCDAGILQSGCFNKMKYDRTLWYTIPLEFAVNSPQAAPLTICQNGEWNNQNTQPLQPAPSLNSEICTYSGQPLVFHVVIINISLVDNFAAPCGINLAPGSRLTEATSLPVWVSAATFA